MFEQISKLFKSMNAGGKPTARIKNWQEGKPWATAYSQLGRTLWSDRGTYVRAKHGPLYDHNGNPLFS